jgi:hypothetical protein
VPLDDELELDMPLCPDVLPAVVLLPDVVPDVPVVPVPEALLLDAGLLPSACCTRSAIASRCCWNVSLDVVGEEALAAELWPLVAL